MNSEDYRPVSPDLAAFKDLPLPPPQRKFSRIPSYSSAAGIPLNYPQYQRNSIDASPFFSPAVSQAPSSYFPTQQHAPAYQTQSPATYPQPRGLSFPPPRTPQEPPLQDHLRSSRIPQPLESLDQENIPHDHQSTDAAMARTLRRRKAVDYDDDRDSTNDSEYNPEATTARNHASKKRKAIDLDPPPAPESEPEPEPEPPTQVIEVRTKFPVARIKRIMQADEDIGKVAQATPTAVSKALELFMITLVTKGANEARAKNSKRVTAQHLKAALMADSHFDFLEAICASVPDQAEKKSRAKSEDHDLDSEEGPATKKKGKGRTKKEKPVDDDED